MAIIKPNNNTISAITALPAGVGGKILAAQITTLAPPAADVTTTSTTYAEMNSAMRITHAMSNSSNKLIFTFASDIEETKATFFCNIELNFSICSS